MSPPDQTEPQSGQPEHAFFGRLPFAAKLWVAFFGPEILHPHGLEVMLGDKGIQEMEAHPEGRFALGALRRKQREEGYGPTELVRLALKRSEDPDTSGARFETHCRILVLYQEALRSQGRFPTVPELVKGGANKGPTQSDSGITRIIDETLMLPRVNGTRLNDFLRETAKIPRDIDFLRRLYAVLEEFPGIYTPIPFRSPDFVCHAVYDYLRTTYQLEAERFVYSPLIEFLPEYSESVFGGESDSVQTASAGAGELQTPPISELEKLCEFAYVDPQHRGDWELSPEGEKWRQSNPMVSIAEHLELPALTQFLAKREQENLRVFADSLGVSGT